LQVDGKAYQCFLTNQGAWEVAGPLPSQAAQTSSITAATPTLLLPAPAPAAPMLQDGQAMQHSPTPTHCPEVTATGSCQVTHNETAASSAAHASRSAGSRAVLLQARVYAPEGAVLQGWVPPAHENDHIHQTGDATLEAGGGGHITGAGRDNNGLPDSTPPPSTATPLQVLACVRGRYMTTQLQQTVEDGTMQPSLPAVEGGMEVHEVRNAKRLKQDGFVESWIGIY